MKQKIKKSRVLWISRDRYSSSYRKPTFDLSRDEPARVGNCWDCDSLENFCSKQFSKLFRLNIRPGQKNKVKITIEVIE
jgi:hypothetical protein